MILVLRGLEPAVLAALRGKKIAILRALAGAPTSADLDGYQLIAEDIWRAQHHKCCYCETPLLRGYNDVEHYRPKAEADRGPHCADRHGYWWLAFTWHNLLFSCPGCNRGKAKGIQFPLAEGSVALAALLEEQPPGLELPLLLDPAVDFGVDHIEFKLVEAEKKWRPFARNGSERGDKTIAVCQLDREDLLEVYTAHVETNVMPEVNALKDALDAKDARALHVALWRAENRLLLPRMPYVGLSYDALLRHVPNEQLAPFGRSWFRRAIW